MTEREEIPCFTFYFIRILKNKIHFFSTTTEKETIPYLTFSIKIPDYGGGEGNSIFYIFRIIQMTWRGEGNSIFYIFWIIRMTRGGNSIFHIFWIILMTGEGKEIPYFIMLSRGSKTMTQNRWSNTNFPPTFGNTIISSNSKT